MVEKEREEKEGENKEKEKEERGNEKEEEGEKKEKDEKKKKTRKQDGREGGKMAIRRKFCRKRKIRERRWGRRRIMINNSRKEWERGGKIEDEG